MVIFLSFKSDGLGFRARDLGFRVEGLPDPCSPKPSKTKSLETETVGTSEKWQPRIWTQEPYPQMETTTMNRAVGYVLEKVLKYGGGVPAVNPKREVLEFRPPFFLEAILALH